MERQITIVVPLPSKHLSPNARVHWGQKARAVKSYRMTCGFIAIAARLAGNLEHPLASAETRVVVYFRDRRKHDADNVLASLKSAFDAFQDARVIVNDRGLRHLPVEFRVDAKDPRVEITLRELRPG